MGGGFFRRSVSSGERFFRVPWGEVSEWDTSEGRQGIIEGILVNRFIPGRRGEAA